MQVFLKTNRFNVDEPQYHGQKAYSFWKPTSSTPVIVKAARECIGALFRPGYRYQKCGVMLFDIQPDYLDQKDLFFESNYSQQDSLMRLVDRVNQQMGRGTLFLGAQGIKHNWGLRCQLRSHRFTTHWGELMTVR